VKKVFPLGTEKINSHGYMVVKVAMSGPKDTLWKEKQRLVWEKANGPMPKGHCVIFLNGNKRDFALKNLAVVSRAENVKLHQFRLTFKDRKLTLAGIAFVKHILAMHSRIEKELGSKKHKLFTDNISRKKRLNERKRANKNRE
jgi:hypothetical protein